MLPGELAKYAGLLTVGEVAPNNGKVPAEFFRLMQEVTAGKPLRRAELEILGASPAVVCNYCIVCLCIGVDGEGVQKLRQPRAVGFTYRHGTYCNEPIEWGTTAPREWPAGAKPSDVLVCPQTGVLMDDLNSRDGNFPKVRITIGE